MYYLKNRYYDPEIRRFINADKYVSLEGIGAGVGEVAKMVIGIFGGIA